MHVLHACWYVISQRDNDFKQSVLHIFEASPLTNSAPSRLLQSVSIRFMCQMNGWKITSTTTQSSPFYWLCSFRSQRKIPIHNLNVSAYSNDVFKTQRFFFFWNFHLDLVISVGYWQCFEKKTKNSFFDRKMDWIFNDFLWFWIKQAFKYLMKAWFKFELNEKKPIRFEWAHFHNRMSAFRAQLLNDSTTYTKS